MEQLNFFDYLGLDQFISIESFIFNLTNYDHSISRSFESMGYVITYKACGEVTTKTLDGRFLMLNPDLERYLRTLFKY